MKKTLIIATYYNAPHFVELQKKSFESFLQDDYDFVVFNDAAPDTKDIITGGPAHTLIHFACDSLHIKHISVPQHVHATFSNGGLVPDGLPANHPTERHRACLHWILKNGLDMLNYASYDAVIIMESDMLMRKSCSIANAIVNQPMIGSGKTNRTMINNKNPEQFWPERIADLDEITINHLNMMMTIFNPKVIDIRNMDIGGFAGTDTGGKTHFFLTDNNYDCKFMQTFNDLENQVDLFAIDDVKNPEFVHYRAGSNWDYQSVAYYKEKLNRMLNNYVPDMGGQPISSVDLMSRDKEHTFKGK